MDFSYINARGNERTCWIRDPRMKDIEILTVASVGAEGDAA